jgi:chromate reductase
MDSFLQFNLYLNPSVRSEIEMKIKNVMVLLGAAHKNSLTRRVANTAIELSPQNIHSEIFEIHNLDIYNEELESSPPLIWQKFRNKLQKSDAFLFVTPDFNDSLPAVLKNAIDIGSRPHGHNSWNAKPAAIVTTSRASIDKFTAGRHLKQSLTFLNSSLMKEPVASFENCVELFDNTNQMRSSLFKSEIGIFMESFKSWINVKIDDYVEPLAVKIVNEKQFDEDSQAYQSKAPGSTYDRFFRFQIYKFSGIGG